MTDDIAKDDQQSAMAERLRSAALQAKDLYEPDSEHVEWTALDGEEIFDDSTVEN